MKKGLLVIFCSIIIANVANSQAYREWINGGSASWNNNSNWSGGYAYAQLEYKGAGGSFTTSNNDRGNPESQWRLYFSGGTSYTLTGNAISLFDFSTNNSWILSQSTVLQTINNNISFSDVGSRQAWITTENSGSFLFGGNVAIAGGVTELRLSCQNASSTITINGVVSGSSKPVQIGRDQGGTLYSNTKVVFAGQNTYTGLTTISAGSLRLNRTGGSTLPSTNNITVANGATLRVSTNQTIADLDLSGGGNLTIDNGATLTVTGTYTPGSGTIDNQGTLVINGSNPLSFPGASANVSYMNNLNINNGSTVTLNNNLDIQGTLTLTSGTFAVAGFSLRLFGPSIAGTPANLATTSGSSLTFAGSNPGPLTLPSSVVNLNNLTIENSNATPARVDINSNLSIAGALTLTSGTLSIGSNTLTLAGTVSRTSGFLRGTNSSNLVVQGSTAKTLDFDQSTDGSHQNPTTGTNSLNNLTLSANGNLKLGNKVNLYGILSTTAGISLDLGDGLLVFRNTATSTSRIADLTSGAGTITGTAISEIYLHAQRRAWRFITNPTPIAGGTIANNWQSAFGYSGGYGTNIYGPAATNGLNSPATVSASMMRFNSALGTLGAYDNVTNTNVDLDGTYFMFVRGDKTVVAVPNGTPAAFTPTTLASKGTIKTGQQTVTLNGLDGRYGAIPNPYLSPVDVSLLTYTGIAGNNATYHWDPLVGNFGGWVSVNSTNWAITSDFRRYMQTGQSALVLMNNATASVVFNEDDKASTKTTQQTGAGNGLQDNFKTTLNIANTDGTKTRVDEMFVAFKNGYNPNFDGNEDAVKMNNSGENLSSKRNNTLIAIEARPYIQNHDSIFMNFTNTRVANYEFEFDPNNFDATVLDAKLVDKFLNTETPISLSAKTTVPFSVTATTGSNAADRFMIVFRGTGALPNKGFTVTGEKLGTNKVKVNWEAQAETGVREYALEKSTNGVNYQTVNTQAAKNGNIANSYTYTDNTPVNGVNYYRVKTTQHNDIERYSTVITVNFKQQSTNNVTVYPNPVKGNTIGLQLQDLEKGMYSVRILSIEGKEVYKQQLQVNGSSLNTTINPSTKLAQGTYTLQVVGKSTTYTQKVVVE